MTQNPISTLVFDTETTGLPKKNQHEELQPHVVQLAGKLFDEDKRVVHELNHIIKPDGWAIPQESITVHGITEDKASKYGLSRRSVLAMFSNIVKKADILVAHNAQFDLKILNLQYKREGIPSPLIGKEVYCTQANSTDILKLPPTDRMKEYGYGECFKSPTLRELCEFFFWGWDETKAHDAIYDVEQCARAYFRLKGLDSEAEIKSLKDRQYGVYKLLHEWVKKDHPDLLLNA